MPASGCIIRMIVSTERWDLLSQCDPRKLAQLLSYIFSDDYLYTHPKMRKLIEADRKGFVDIDEINKEPTIIEYFLINPLAASQHNTVIRKVVIGFCHELLVKGKRIRRVRPFNISLFTQIKPICIQKIKQPLTISDVRHHLGPSAFSQVQIFTPSNDFQFYYIYAPDYRHRKKDEPMPFRLIQYSKVCAERERESRYWQQQQKRTYSALSVELRHPMRQGREDYRSRMSKNIDEQQQMGEEQASSSAQQIRSIIKKPNPMMNQLLVSYMGALNNRLDQQ